MNVLLRLPQFLLPEQWFLWKLSYLPRDKEAITDLGCLSASLFSCLDYHREIWLEILGLVLWNTVCPLLRLWCSCSIADFLQLEALLEEHLPGLEYSAFSQPSHWLTFISYSNNKRIVQLSKHLEVQFVGKSWNSYDYFHHVANYWCFPISQRTNTSSFCLKAYSFFCFIETFLW